MRGGFFAHTSTIPEPQTVNPRSQAPKAHMFMDLQLLLVYWFGYEVLQSGQIVNTNSVKILWKSD